MCVGGVGGLCAFYCVAYKFVMKEKVCNNKYFLIIKMCRYGLKGSPFSDYECTVVTIGTRLELEIGTAGSNPRVLSLTRKECIRMTFSLLFKTTITKTRLLKYIENFTSKN